MRIEHESEYQANVLGRASQEWHNNLIDRGDLMEICDEIIKGTKLLDQVKKALFYGQKPEGEFFILDVEHPLNGSSDYATRNLVHAILGVATEAGEMLEALLANLAEAKPFDEVNLQEEFGDLNWYRVLGLAMLGQTQLDNMNQNDDKLEARFGKISEGFTAKRAINRDLEAERKSLEG